jgi:hypothetical protein
MATNLTFDDRGAYVTWNVRENCTWSRAFTAKDSAGTAINITAYTITAEITADETTDAASKTFTTVQDRGGRSGRHAGGRPLLVEPAVERRHQRRAAVQRAIRRRQLDALT